MTPHQYDPLGMYGSSADVFDLLAKRGDSPEAATQFVDTLRKVIEGSRRSVKDIFPDEQSDAGRVLLEVFSLLHWNTLRFLEDEARGLLSAGLALAGLQRRAAWPAAAVFRVKPDKTAPLDTANVVISPPSELETASRPVTDLPRFRPAWPTTVCKYDELTGWDLNAGPLDLFIQFVEKNEPENKNEPEDRDDAREAVLNDIWNARKWAYGGTQLVLSHPLDSADPRFRVPGVWPVETDQPNSVALGWVQRQFIRLSGAAGTTPTGPITFNGKEFKPDGVSIGAAKIHPNAALWIDWHPTTDDTSPEDYPGAFATPQGDSKGAAGNLATPQSGVKNDDGEKWSVEGESELTVFRLTRAVGGQDAESSTAFLQRAPVVLRTAGAPVSARDWEELVADLDPGRRVTATAVRPAYFSTGSRTSAGIDIAFHTAGGPLECENTARGLAPDLRRRLELLRPLGTGIRLFYPTFRHGCVVIRAGDNASGTFGDERRDRLTAHLSPAALPAKFRKNDRPCYWPLALDMFRNANAEPHAEKVFRYFCKEMLFLTAGAYTTVWFEEREKRKEPPTGLVEVEAWQLVWVEQPVPPHPWGNS